MEDNKDLEVKDTESAYLHSQDIEYIDGVAISIYDGNMSDIKNCDAIFVSVNTNLVILDGNSSIDVSDLVEYAELKERVDANTLELKCGDSCVFTVKKDSELGKRGIAYVIAIITPEWQNGLNRYEIVDQMDKGLYEALILSSYYDIDSIVISNIFPFMPTPLVMDVLSHCILSEVNNFKEVCIVRGNDAEGVYRMNVLVNQLIQKHDGDLYIRLGGDVENDLLTKMITLE